MDMLSLFPQLLDFGALGPVFLRIGLAVVFIAHGYPKLFKNFLGTAQFFESINIKPGKFWVAVVGVTEFFGGLLLLVGIFTQLIALLLAFDMLVAIFKVRRPLVGGYEIDLVLLLSALALAVLGAGAFSLDLPL